MGKILITGATGHLGGETLDFVLHRLPAQDVAALARKPAKLAHRAAAGVDVRQGDYFDYQSLVRAFDGIDTLLLISAVAFTDRVTQEANAVRAAKAAGVRHVVYTSIQKRNGSTFKVSQSTDANDRTEKSLADSGMQFTILRNSLYLDALPASIGEKILTSGIRVPAGDGRAALAKRIELAEGAAVALTQIGHENKTYTLGASEAFSFADIAVVVSEATGRAIDYLNTPTEKYVAAAVAAGVPEPFAAFRAEWMTAIAFGEFAEVTGDLEHLIGRKPTGYREFFRAAYAAKAPA